MGYFDFNNMFGNIIYNQMAVSSSDIFCTLSNYGPDKLLTDFEQGRDILYNYCCNLPRYFG